MNTNTILIIYSVANTSKTHIDESKSAISGFTRTSGAATRCAPHLFEIPSSAKPGGSLGADLHKDLRRCAGAVVFVDDLRPNIIYELGFFHGQGRPVLLLTTNDVEAFWGAITDLAGASVGNFAKRTITSLIHSYLDSLHELLARIPAWPTTGLPDKPINLISVSNTFPSSSVLTEQEWGHAVQVNGWQHVDCMLGLNLTNDARFNLVLRGGRASTAYTIYFYLHYVNSEGKQKQIWIGLTCNDSSTDIGDVERTLPAQRINTEWHCVNGSFMELLLKAVVLDVDRLEHLEIVRFRAGKEKDRPPHSFKVGYVSITGTRN